ncbi:hypothetical protein FUAX_29340 [Fulvitalea axinellae]|uniref:TolB-like 6-blade propeller-like n=1 Tax=Fulvitalea axinellae TaxID=1182444 RepID=A0AAU9CTW4_9BACT|nr:hypothetical protein FUAX_29340 [Fulvitalea axinellae]
MKILTRFSLVVLVVVLFWSCGETKVIRVSEAGAKFTEFPDSCGIAMKKVIDVPGIITGMCLADSTLFMLNSKHGREGRSLYNYYLGSDSLSLGYVTRGRGPGEVLGANSICLAGGKLWMFDITLEKFLVSRESVIDAMPDKAGMFAEVRLEKDRNVYALVAVLNDSAFVSSANLTSPFKVTKVNMGATPTVSHFGEYHGEVDSSYVGGLKKAFNALPFAHPSGEKLVLAYTNTDVIEIYDTQKERRLVAIHGPDNITLDFEQKQKFARAFIRDDKDDIRTFEGGAVTEEYIYLIYSGKPLRYMSNGRRLLNLGGKSILVYDWEGNPVKKFLLDKQVVSISVSQNDEMLYAFDVNEGCLVKADIKMQGI